jgi:hypothetical protein
VAAAYARFCRRLARHGITRHPSEGPDAFRKRAAAAYPELAAAIAAISEWYIRLRYGKAAAGDADRAARAADVGDFQRAVARFHARA